MNKDDLSFCTDAELVEFLTGKREVREEDKAMIREELKRRGVDTESLKESPYTAPKKTRGHTGLIIVASLGLVQSMLKCSSGHTTSGTIFLVLAILTFLFVFFSKK
jgi:hypothetical protein